MLGDIFYMDDTANAEFWKCYLKNIQEYNNDNAIKKEILLKKLHRTLCKKTLRIK